MKRNILALSVFLLFLGVVLASSSSVVVKPAPVENWVVVKEVTAKDAETLSIQGNLNETDKFRVHFTKTSITGQYVPIDSGVIMNITDPSGQVKSYDLPVATDIGRYTKSYLQLVANETGTYDVYAEAYGVALSYLGIKKSVIEQGEPSQPYNFLLPIGIGLLLVGVGTPLVDAKVLKGKKANKSKR